MLCHRFFPNAKIHAIPLALLLGFLLATACADTQKEKPRLNYKFACPKVIVPLELSERTRFLPRDSRSLSDVAFVVTLRAQGLTCLYDPDTDSLSVTLQASLEIKRGPKGKTGRSTNLSYFTAVVQRQTEVLKKKTFSLWKELPPLHRSADFQQDISLQIPLSGTDANSYTGVEYKVYIGLSLKEEELQYNQQFRQFL